MKHVGYSILLIICTFSVPVNYALSKKDKQDMATLLQEPLEQMRQLIGQLNAFSVVNNDTNHHDHENDIKQLGEKILAEVHEVNCKVDATNEKVDTLNDKIDQTFQQIAILRILVGNPDDPSVDPAQFDSVQAIDDAKLPLYVLAKTALRAIVEGNIVS